MKRSLLLLPLLIVACTTEQAPQYALAGGEKGVFSSRQAGSPISLESIKGKSEQELATLFGAASLDRRDGQTRVLRYQSDACTLFVYVTGGRASFVDAYDTHLRPLAPPDQCAGSVSAQKKRSA
jgi:hypothetical protein